MPVTVCLKVVYTLAKAEDNKLLLEAAFLTSSTVLYVELPMIAVIDLTPSHSLL